MNGYKTGGDWTDVTSIGRNEVVFEGRHKAYGAFYIRKRYPNALYLSFLSAITFIAVCVAIPYALRNIASTIPLPDRDFVVRPYDPVIHPPVQPPPLPRTTIKPPKTPVTRFTPPVITSHSIDSAAPIKPDDRTVIPPTGTDPHGDSTAETDNKTTGGGGITPPEIPKDDKVRTWVSEMPKFPGNIEDYLGKQISYSAEEVQLGIQGTVYVSFVIEKDGSVTNVNMEKGISGGTDLNREALRVISGMPKWSPGKQDGYPVRVQYMIPIHFKLQ
jgi:periplasmic protein TonB